MARSARTISVNFSAGTAKFFTDVDRANAKIKEFGSAHVGEAAASRAALHALEGQMFNNTRAADKFIETVLGGGPLLQAAFPVIGAVAFGGVIVEVSKKVYEFFKDMEEAPRKIDRAFRGLSDPIRLTNDELAVANDHLANEIAKLEGRHENTLSLALHEASVEADRLADSLDKALTNLHKVLKEQEPDWSRRLFGGEAGTAKVTEEIDRFREEDIARITEEGNKNIRAATTAKERDAAQTELNTKVLAAYGEEIKKLDSLTAAAAEKAKAHRGVVYDPQTGLGMERTIPGANEATLLRNLARARDILEREQTEIKFRAVSDSETARQKELDAARANTDKGRPFEDRMKALNAQIDGLKEKLKAVGQPEEAQALAKAFGAAALAIEQLNKQYEGLHVIRTKAQREAQEGEIKASEQTIASTEAEIVWQTKLAASSVAIEGRIRSQELLTAAIGKGHEATRAAIIEGRLIAEQGQHVATLAEQEKMRADIGRELDAQDAGRSKQAIERLNDQIELERALAAAQKDGAEAVRKAGLDVKLNQMLDRGASLAELTAEAEKYNAERGNVLAGDVARINEKIAATRQLTAALAGGDDAERRAALENKYAQIRKDDPSGEKERDERRYDAAEHEKEITKAALATGMAYQNRLSRIGEELAALDKVKAAEGGLLAVEISRRSLENERLQLLAGESLQLRGARDGARAFFLEMQADAKSAASIVYDALHSSLDRVSGELANLATGRKTNFGKAFEDIGHQMAESAIKSAAQEGLGKLGEHFGPAKKIAEALGLNKKDGSSEALALWVRLAGAMPAFAPVVPAAGEGGADLPDTLALGKGTSARAAGFFQKLFSSFLGGGGSVGGDGLTPSVSSSIVYQGARALGGPVDPGRAYKVGERGEEIFVPSQRGTIIPNGTLGATENHYDYHIDARGADLGAQNRIARGIEASHRLAVTTAVQVSQERMKRVPGR